MSDALTLAEVAELDELMARSVEPVAPPSFLKARILEAARNTPQNSVTVRADEGRWKMVVPGVEMKRLARDASRGTVTLMLRLAPRAVLPEHDHHGSEKTYVIDGSCHIGSVGLSKGDFHQVDAGEHHGTVVSGANGCTLLLTVDESDYRAA
jgi:putative transcriptional regulator